MKIEPYLFLECRCEEAIEFYKKAIGAKVVMLMRNDESPEPHPPGMLPPGSEKKVLHATVQIGESQVMMSDGHCSGKTKFSGFSLSLRTESDAQAEKAFAALSEGGQATMPLTKTFFTSKFGMLVDRFGVEWMVIVQQ